MPQRATVRTIPTPEIQGEDSWVKVCALKMSERLQVQQENKGLDPNSKEAIEHGFRVIAEHVLEWNWVDDKGEPLPQPFGRPDVIAGLTDAEGNFLAGLFVGPSPATLKNSATGSSASSSSAAESRPTNG